MKKLIQIQLAALALLAAAESRAATATDPRTNSWFTAYSCKYARIYATDASRSNGVSVTTWTNGTTVQSLPAYCGVQELYSSSNWVYLRTTGLGSHVMGAWYLNSQHTQLFPNWPVNQKTLYRIPRNPTVPATKTANGGGPIGYFVDGVAMFNSWDAYFWNGTTETNGNGTGYWNRDAYVNEGPSFDANNSHQANGQYHYHVNVPILRYELGDHVDYADATLAYTEDTNPPTRHSPILAWTADGYPLYGPYGYSNATNANSGVRRMVSGYVLRNGQNGADNLTNTLRTNLPAWAQRLYKTNSAGPTNLNTYPIGRYMEDNAYLGDLTNTVTHTNYQPGADFDLDEYNGRYCVTPEFPSGTYAYFVSINSNGTPVFPYNIGRGFYASPTGGSVSAIAETVVTNFLGGTNTASTLGSPADKNGTVTLTWSAVEGGSYQVEASTNLATSAWTVLQGGISPSQTTGGYTNITSLDKRFYRVGRNAVASYDNAGTTTFAVAAAAPGGNASRNQAVLLTITLPSTPPAPPIDRIPTNITVGASISLTGNITRPDTNTVQVLFTVPAGAATGTQNVGVSFSPAPVYTLTNGFTIN